MKINDTNVAGLASSGVGKAQEPDHSASSRSGRTGSSGGVSTDHVQLSNLSESLRASDGESPDRAVRLQALSAEVEAGRYHVDASELSKSIIKDSTSA